MCVFGDLGVGGVEGKSREGKGEGSGSKIGEIGPKGSGELAICLQRVYSVCKGSIGPN